MHVEAAGLGPGIVLAAPAAFDAALLGFLGRLGAD